MKVTLQDLRSAPNPYSHRRGFCTKGFRAWCKAYGVDFDEARRVGVDEAAIEASGDPIAMHVLNHARETRRHG